MIISKGNIVFRRLVHEDIELVRNWRNSSQVSQFMEYRDYITPEMQEKWFKSVNNNHNLYFVIEYKNEKIGLINGKYIDWEKRSMETGIFIWDKKYLNTHIPLLAVLIFGELGIMTFGLTAYAHILKTNHRAKRYNRLLGFRLCEGQEDVENQLYVMTKESYFKKAKFIRGAFLKLTSNENTVLKFEQHDYYSDFADFLYDKLNDDKIERVEKNDGLKTLYFKSFKEL
ncbi:MAG: GNAT family N-acetyltransferase [Bacteroidetes bacterium]|nr:GNAT family N-acetyltransferase [Bacteroidota bacterium]MBL6944500.1 GNAT family N-acetyltransferase [Bacteroidales bacterium]